MRANNLTLLTDLYELTMMQGYFKNPTNQTVIFDMFYRTNPCGGAFAITAGLEQMIEYIENLKFTDEDIEYLRSLNTFEEDFLEYLSNFRFTGDIYAIPEGTVVFPREPLVKVVAPIMEAQLVETAILNIINHQSLIATKAARVCYAAKVMRSWNLVCVVPRDRMQVSLAHVPQSSVDVPVLPVFSQAKCSTYRSLELTHTAGS